MVILLLPYDEQDPPGETEDRGRDRVVLRGLLAPKLSMALLCFFGLPAVITQSYIGCCELGLCKPILLELKVPCYSILV